MMSNLVLINKDYGFLGWMDQIFFYRRLVLLDKQKSYFFLLSFFLKVSILMETQDEKNQIKYTFWIYQNSVKHCKHTSD